MPRVPPGHSFTRLNTFASECERRYFLDCFSPFERTPQIARGDHVHRAIEAVALKIMGGAAAREAVASVSDCPPEGIVGEEELAGYLRRVRPILEKLTPVGVERWFSECDGLPVRGKIDIVSSTGLLPGGEVRKTVVDWKTTGNPNRPERARRELAHSLQLKIYCLAEGCQDAAFVFLLPGEGEPIVVGRHYTKNELAVARQWLSGTIEVVNRRWADARESSGDSPAAADSWDMSVFALARPGMPWCSEKWCQHYKVCFPKKGDDE